MNVKPWPFLVFLVSLVLFTLPTLIYLVLGIVIKLGHGVLVDEDMPEEAPHMPSSADLLVDAYHVVTWPWYVFVVGTKRTIMLMAGGASCLVFMIGFFYVIGSNASAPNQVEQNYLTILNARTSQISTHVQGEVLQRIEMGLDYNDIKWIHQELRKACGSDQANLDLISDVTNTMMMGLFQIFPIYGDTVMVLSSEVLKMECSS